MKVVSPLFYMGNKFDLLDNLLMFFPHAKDVNQFVDVFGGSSVVSVNVPYKNVLYNELNVNTFNIVEMLMKVEGQVIAQGIRENVEKYDLPKGYYDLREEYNKNRKLIDLYTLTYYSFSNLFRFNNDGDFNMPVGNQKYNNVVHGVSLVLYQMKVKEKNITLRNGCGLELLESIKKDTKDMFIYLDPPYLNTTAVYNEKRAGGGWDIEDDKRMFKELNRLNKLGVKWAMSNVLENKGIKNHHLEKWANDNGYTIIYFDEKTYSALGKGNSKAVEVLIINYRPPFEQLSMFD